MAADESVNVGQWDAFVPPGRGGRWPLSSALSGWLGLVLLGLIVAATTWWGVKHFETRLEGSVRAELNTAGVNPDQLNFDWSYRDVAVSGNLQNGDTEEQLLAVMREADSGGIRSINIELDATQEEPVKSAQFGVVDVTANLESGQILLQGTVLTESQRDRLQAAAVQAIGAAGVLNKITVSGLQEKTPGSDQRVDSLANSIAGLDQAVSADARLSATDFRFNATVADETQADDLLRLRGNAGDIGLVISGDIVTRKSAPGSVDVAAVKENGRIVLTGVVTSEAQKQTLLAAANRAFDSQSVTDEIVVAEVAGSETADESVAVLASAINFFDEAIDADARVTEEEFEFNALLEFEEDTAPLQVVRENASGIGLSLSGSIVARQMSLNKEVSMLQAEVDSLSDEIRENIVFESGKADLSFKAKQTLDKIVDAMNRYQRPVVEIAGHTDDSGAADANEKLSLFRASAVLEYFKLSGIDGLRVRALGFGETSPIASNSTEVGKSQNRRVEFTARGNFGN